MKRLIILILVVGLLTVVGFAVRYELEVKARERLEEEAHQKREASYELSRREYSQALKPGMKRKEVEAYLHQKNTPLVQMCCIDGNNSKHALDDLTKIGQEDAPWFCSKNNIYVAFQFDDRGQHGPHWDANESDMLSKITMAGRLPVEPLTSSLISTVSCRLS